MRKIFIIKLLRKQIQRKNAKIMKWKQKSLKGQIETYKNLLKESEAKREQIENENQQKLRMLKDYKSNNQQLIDQNSQQSVQINQLKSEKEQYTARIASLESLSQALKFEYQFRTQQYLQFQSSSIRIENLRSQQPQSSITPQTVEDLQNFYSDEQKQRREINFYYQIRYLESIIQKVSDDKTEEQKMNCRLETTQAIIFSEWLNIYQILLDEDQFSKSIKEKNFYFRKNCLIKNKVSQIQQRQLNQDTEIVITIDNQRLTIRNVHETCNAEYQALDIILNMLLTEGYAKLFERDHQQINSENQLREQWSIKIPRQFLIQDDIGNYHIYQEQFGNDIDQDFSPFRTADIVDQFISSFYQYFYFATNKNLALTECKILVQLNKFLKRLNEVIITRIVINSKYQKVFSKLDKGEDKIKNFERERSENPRGATQQFWSPKMYEKAEQVWYDQ
ncbi:unnamed protein product [Paramecium primaurelia]|uniref:Uncharacterized protein n=1 Tax=Paramecium primaurelia TaxID=5886 RepID=A0A8S1MKN1_PARPR|nr:unnamed protein product [Paramecium primaurelia]